MALTTLGVCRAPRRSGGAAPASTRTVTSRQRPCVQQTTPAPPGHRWCPRTDWGTTPLCRRRVCSLSLPWWRRGRDISFRRWTNAPLATIFLFGSTNSPLSISLMHFSANLLEHLPMRATSRTETTFVGSASAAASSSKYTLATLALSSIGLATPFRYVPPFWFMV